jgi:Na+-transporting NADH:ubiquinone oxidoreductase subunit A
MAMHRIKRGLDLPLAGAPEARIDDARPVSRAALLAADTIGLRPAFAVQPGERVLRGQLLYEDRKNPGVRFTSPAAGSVSAIHRGDKRAFVSIVIEVADDDDPRAQAPFAALPRSVTSASAAELRALLLESGMWTSFRTRPFSRIPAADAAPQALFVTAIDTRPHAPDPQLVLAGREDDFHLGMAVLEKMFEAPVHLCLAEGSKLGAGHGSRALVHQFTGPHPAGTPGLHMHLLHPVGAGRVAWHIDYADVAAIGHLLATGELETRQIVSLAGPAVRTPRLLRSRRGASVDQLSAGELHAGEVRVISGSVLDGRVAAGDAAGYLGRYHHQVSALHEGRDRELLGWLTPQKDKFSVWGVVAGHFARRGLPLTTTTNGGERAMVPIGSYERVMPMDVMATHLLRALITGDAERAVALGALELDEEDLALATFVCPGKTEYGALLRRLLDRIEKEGV